MTIHKIKIQLLLLIILFGQITVTIAVPVGGNTTIDSFNKAKKYNERYVYNDHRVTLYCGATFNKQKKVSFPVGFKTTKYKNRQKKLEWEHVVAAENFGRNFKEWREGHSACINKKGKAFKGRKCAEKTNKEYRYMQSDMHNLFPAIGAVNAMRSNYNFTMLPELDNSFGSCEMKIGKSKVEPPLRSRGQIARTYKYMDSVYSRYQMSRQQRQLMDAWDKMYPVNQWECTRARRIEKVQGNPNLVVLSRCSNKNL